MTESSTSQMPPTGTPTALDDGLARLRRSSVRRDTDRRWFGGVCAGVAARFDVDPLLIRAAAIALTIAGGSSLVVSGPGLGLAGQSRLQFLSSTAPTLTNNVISGVFGNDGANPGMVTTGAVAGGVGLRLLDPATEYVSTFAAAGTTSNVRITAPEATG